MPRLGGTMSAYIDIGLPITPGGEARVVGLAYSAASATLISTVALPSDSAYRFFIRGQNELCYRELMAPGPEFSFKRDLVVAINTPFAFVMLQENSTRNSAVYAVGLPDGRLAPLPHPTGYPAERIWISHLLASSADATWLHVVAAEISPRSDGGYSVIYSLAQMNVSAGHLDKIVDLPTPFA